MEQDMKLTNVVGEHSVIWTTRAFVTAFATLMSFSYFTTASDIKTSSSPHSNRNDNGNRRLMQRTCSYSCGGCRSASPTPPPVNNTFVCPSYNDGETGNISGGEVFFNEGGTMPQGHYVVRYGDGCFKYGNDLGWTVHASNRNRWYLVSDPGDYFYYNELPGITGILPWGAYSDFETCVTANAELSPALIYHPGGTLAIKLEDEYYEDNVHGQLIGDGYRRDPSWILCYDPVATKPPIPDPSPLGYQLPGDILGGKEYFAGGMMFYPGIYTVTYVSGCMKYGPDSDWTVHDGRNYRWHLESDNGLFYNELPGTVGRYAEWGAYLNFEDCQNANKKLPSTTIYHPGGSLALVLEDSYPVDNVHGLNGSDPKWAIYQNSSLAPSDPGKWCWRQETLVGNIFGKQKYFNKGAPISRGIFTITYKDGCMQYDGSKIWTVHDGFAGNYWYGVSENDDGTTASWTPIPGTTLSEPSAGPNTFEECVAATSLAPPKTFYHPGGKLAVWLDDNGYRNNIHGKKGRDPSWTLNYTIACR